MSFRVLPLLVALAVLAGCVNKAPTTRPAVPSAGGPKLAAAAATLTGKVKLLSDAGGNIISDNGGGIISNNTGNIISDNGGGLVSNNGSSLTGKVKRGLLQAKAPHEFFLADAKIAVADAAGKPVLGADGQPLTTTTDAHGNYSLTGVLPDRNLVLRIRLWNGGELSAMLPRTTGKAASQAIDTASSLGAAYVLGNYVRGDQATFDKLPGAEAAKLQAGLASAQNLIATAPDYQPAALVALTDTLRAKAPAVDGTLKEIQALLLGQANLGEGLQATTVAIFNPRGMALDAQANLYVAEAGFGRIRQVAPDGKLSTFADVVRGKVKRNFPALLDMVRAADGTFYVCGLFTAGSYVYKVAPSGEVTVAAGTGDSRPGAVDAAATTVPLSANRLALGPDGTLYVGEQHTFNADVAAPRLLALGSDGIMRNLPVPGVSAPDQRINGVAAGADGAVYLLVGTKDAGSQVLLRREADGTVKTLATGFSAHGFEDGYLAVGADGTAYVSEPVPARVTAVAPNGTRKVIAGDGAGGGPTLSAPRNLLVAPDGTLLVADVAANLVHALAPDGTWSVRAGTTRSDGGGNLRDLAIDAPYGLAFDPQAHLYVSESGSNRVDAFDGTAVTTLAGSVKGLGGDGGPAKAALLAGPKALAWRDGTLWILDGENERLRKVGPDGTIETAVGGSGTLTIKNDQRVPASQFRVRGIGLAIAPDGQPYWTSGNGQVLRLSKDGFVELVAGVGHTSSEILPVSAGAQGIGAAGPAKLAALGLPGGLAFDSQGDLYVTDVATLLVCKIHDPGGAAPTISTYAGVSISAYLSGLSEGQADGKTAHEVAFSGPAGLVFDAQDNLYVAELGRVALPLFITLPADQLDLVFGALPPSYARVRKIARDGTVTNVAGPGAKYFPDPTSEDGLVMPVGLALAPDGRLAIADPGANLIRVLPAGSF